MITKPWAPSAAPASEQASGTLHVNTICIVTDFENKLHEVPLFSAMYAAIIALRHKLPCGVSVNGEDVFSYDGKEFQQTDEFALTLMSFERYLLIERKAGAEEAAAIVRSELAQPLRVDEGAQPEAAAQGDHADQAQEGRDERGGDERQGRRQGPNRRR